MVGAHIVLISALHDQLKKNQINKKERIQLQRAQN